MNPKTDFNHESKHANHESGDAQHKNDAQHLREDQFGELLDLRTDSAATAELAAAKAHIEQCAECRAELEGLRSSLALFRVSATEFASQQLRADLRQRIAVRTNPTPSWTLRPQLAWVAAGLLVAATALPLHFHEQQVKRAAASAAMAASSASGQTKESDAALLDDINRELSASVPESMQALADPTASSSGSELQTTTRKN